MSGKTKKQLFEMNTFSAEGFWGKKTVYYFGMGEQCVKQKINPKYDELIQQASSGDGVTAAWALFRRLGVLFA